MQTIKSIDDFNRIKTEEPATLFYFSHEKCSVCKVLKPKVEQHLLLHYPLIKMYYIQIDIQMEIAAQNSIFVAPSLLIYFNGNESYRYSRNLGIQTLEDDIKRPYELLFS